MNKRRNRVSLGHAKRWIAAGLLMASCVAVTASQDPSQIDEGTSGFRDADCVRVQQVLSELLSGENRATILGSCRADRGVTVFAVSIRNMAPDDVGPLHQFGLSFCGNPVLSAAAPPGWVASINRRHSQTDVEWAVDKRQTEYFGVVSGQTAIGFSIRLNRGWRRAHEGFADWNATTVGQLTTHDC